MLSQIRFRSTRVTILAVASLVIVLVAFSSAADRLLDPSLYLPDSPLEEALARHDDERDTHSRASDLGIPTLGPIDSAAGTGPDLLAIAMSNAFPTSGLDPVALAKAQAPTVGEKRVEDHQAGEEDLPCPICPGERDSLLVTGLNANSLSWPLLFPMDPVMLLPRGGSSSAGGVILPLIAPQPPGGDGTQHTEDPGTPPSNPPHDPGPTPPNGPGPNPPPDEPPQPPGDDPRGPQPVPEPATLLLTALGAGGLIARRMRARR